MYSDVVYIFYVLGIFKFLVVSFDVLVLGTGCLKKNDLISTRKI